MSIPPHKDSDPMPLRPPWTAALASTLLLVALQGCAAPMTPTDTPRYPPADHFPATMNRLKDGPYRFWQHNFGAYCFDTWGCRVTYGPHRVLDQPESRQFPPAPPGYLDAMDAGWLGLKNFEGPVVLDWKSKDRTPLHLELDLARIFADGLIRYRVADELIDPDASAPDPGIVVEINDRTVRVYMDAFLSLKAPRTPGNPHSNYADDKVLVFERTL
jgi:hypothetical protein